VETAHQVTQSCQCVSVCLLLQDQDLLQSCSWVRSFFLKNLHRHCHAHAQSGEGAGIALSLGDQAERCREQPPARRMADGDGNPRLSFRGGEIIQRRSIQV
jgi:hypothetical protein